MVDTVLLAEHDWRDKEKEERDTKKKENLRKWIWVAPGGEG